MAETPSGIPDRPWFKPSEVCEIAAIQPYVLRSWESEFQGLGVALKGRPGRLYRKADVEQVLRIKRLMLEEGLTLAGVRRRIEGGTPAAQPEETLDGFIGEEARVRLVSVRRSLRSLLDQLSGGAPAAPAEGPRAAGVGAGGSGSGDAAGTPPVAASSLPFNALDRKEGMAERAAPVPGADGPTSPQGGEGRRRQRRTNGM